MRSADSLVFAIYLVGILVIGMLFARRRSSSDDFLVGGRTAGFLPLGLSIMASLFNAVNFTSYSGEVATQGIYVLALIPVLLIVSVPVLVYVIPFYFEQGGVSAYAFLEQRFDGRVRRMVGGLFLLWRIAWMTVGLYAASRFLATTMGVDFKAMIAVVGLATTAYTAAGGFRAVIWTDVAQVVVIFASILAGLVFALHSAGGFEKVLELAQGNGILRPVSPFDPDFLSFDPRIRMTVWSCLIGGFTAFIARYGADQMVVQRYLAARSLRHARIGFALNIGLAASVLVLLAILGMAVGVQEWDGSAGIARPMERLVSFYASLPAGLLGLLAAGLVASAMSSLDAGVNACCATIVTDFKIRDGTLGLRWFSGKRVITVILGLVITILAMFVGRLGSLFEIANRVINGLGSPVLALVLAGVFSKRVTANGMLAGGLAGFAASVVISSAVDHLALHYYAFANLLITLLLCHVFSLILPGSRAPRTQPRPAQDHHRGL